jgi:hypothetical protein
MGRTVIVGDVHGCGAELDTLLDRLAFSADDRLVFVGDLIARGPDNLRVLDIARATGAVIVRGNHEQKLLTWRAKKAAHARGLGKRPERLGRVHAHVAASLRTRDWKMLQASPVFHDMPEHNLRVVHAGVVPNLPFEAQRPQTLMRIRGVSLRGEPMDKGAYVLWGTLYVGPPHIVFGHNAMADPQIHRWATGIDTSCVYGGRLTAMVIPHDERVPRGKDVLDLLWSVPARRAYYLGPSKSKRVA